MNTDIQAFYEIAERFCRLVETADQFTLLDRMQQFAVALADLYALGWRLPESQSNERKSPPFEIEISDWAGFEDLTLYWEITDPYEWEGPVTASLTDDLLDIYKDLKIGFIVADSDGAEAAIYYWQSYFAKRWGNHAVDALRALHRAIARYKMESKP